MQMVDNPDIIEPDQESSAGATGPRRHGATGDRVRLAGFLATVIVIYAFAVSAGHWWPWPFWSSVYDHQAEGFRSGHLYIDLPPHPALRTLAHPLDPANMKHWNWDYSYRDGHLYIYWGLAPAALLAAVKVLLRLNFVVGDQVLVFAFLVGRLLAGSLLIRSMARRMASPPSWAVWSAMGVFAIANPIPFLLARGAVYEAAISGGACFLTAGFYFCFEGVFADDERPAGRWFLAAGVALGLAATCRTSLAPAAVVLAATTILGVWRPRAGQPGATRRLVALAARVAGPLAGLGSLHLVLNYLRYGAWLDFGQRHQMGKTFGMGLRYVVANLWSYAVRPITASCRFPFLLAEWHEKNHVPQRDHLPSWLPVAADYHAGEPAGGMLLLTPFVLLTLGLLAPRAPQMPGSAAPDAETQRRWRFFLTGLALTTLVAAVPGLLAIGATMRYSADFSSGCLLLAAVGSWRLLRAPASRTGHTVLVAVIGALTFASIAVGLLLGFSGYFDHFATNNPALMSRLGGMFSFCSSR
jgi:hypothetical protein